MLDRSLAEKYQDDTFWNRRIAKIVFSMLWLKFLPDLGSAVSQILIILNAPMTPHACIFWSMILLNFPDRPLGGLCIYLFPLSSIAKYSHVHQKAVLCARQELVAMSARSHTASKIWYSYVHQKPFDPQQQILKLTVVMSVRSYRFGLHSEAFWCQNARCGDCLSTQLSPRRYPDSHKWRQKLLKRTRARQRLVIKITFGTFMLPRV